MNGQCGDQRPQCRRCVKNGYECEYPDPLELNFRSENDKAAERAASLWRQRSAFHTGGGRNDPVATNVGGRETSPSHTTSSRSSSRNSSPPINRSPNTQLANENRIQRIAVSRFFKDFGCTSKVRTPWLDFFRLLPDFYQKPSGDDSPIVHIILAVSLAYLIRDGSYQPCEIMARMEYCEAINKINAHLQRHTQVPINELLASISLMGFFESLMPSSSTIEDLASGNRKYFTHLRGAIAMVRMIEMQSFDAPNFDPRVVNIVYFQTVVTCIRNRIRPPLSIFIWDGQTGSPLPRNPGAPIMHLMYQAACWQADIDTAMANASVDPCQAKARIIEMLATLRNADMRISQWESTLPPHLVFYVRDSTYQGDEYPLSRNHALLNLPGAPFKIYTFQSCWSTTPRVLAFVIRAVLHRNVVKCCTWMMAQDQSQAQDWLFQSSISRNIIIDMIEQISCSVNSLLMDSFIMPYHVSEQPQQNHDHEHNIGKSMRLMGLPWPVSVATMALQDDYVLQGVGQQRARWLRDVLDYVHHNVGMYFLSSWRGFECYLTDQFVQRHSSSDVKRIFARD